MRTGKSLSKNGESYSEVPTRGKVDFRWFTEQYLRNEKYQRFSFENFPYLVEIYDNMAEEIVLKKASQMGITAWAINKVIWLSVNFVIVAIYTMPTGADVSDLSQGRFNPVLQYSDLDIARDVDNIGMKKIGM